MAYAPFAFWFWDGPLDPRRAAQQAAEMLRQGFNPGYVHPRTGLPPEQWLSPAWFRSLRAGLDQAEARGGYMGYCDEYDWPSGRAGGRVLATHPELAAVSLRWDVADVSGDEDAHLPASFFTVAAQVGGDGRLLSRTLRLVGGGAAFTWRAPAGAWRVYSFSRYHHPGLDGSPVNYLDDRLTDAFMGIAYKPYERALRDRMGRNLCGLFIDNEGDYGWKLAWSDHLARVYRTRYGRDIRLWMPLLVAQDAEGLWARARWEWLDVVSDIYADGFFGKLSRWCADRGMSCTMHVWEESLLLQAEAVGDYFKVMRAVSMPGTDSLVKKPLLPEEFKETQSVSEFEGRRACSEVLGVIGWDLTPTLLRQTTNAITAWGVSHVMPHGVYLRQELNTIPYPPDFYAENPYWPYFHLWTDYTRRASYVISHGHTVPDVLLMNPMDTMWASIGEWLLAPNDAGVRAAQHVNAVYFDALRRLADARVEFLVGDRYYVRRMRAAPGGTLALGDFRFRSVVLPPITVLPLDVARKLVAFARAGGRIYVLGELPTGSTDHGMGDPAMRDLVAELRSLPTVVACRQGLAAELARPGTGLASRVAFESGAFPMIQSHRRIDGRDFLWLANNAEARRQCTVLVRGARGAASVWDCETGRVAPLPSEQTAGGSRVRLTFGPYEGYFLVLDPSSSPRAPAAAPMPPAPAPTVTITGPWRVRVDPAAQPRLGPDSVKLCSVPWRASWLRVDGSARFRHELVLPADPVRATLWLTADQSLALYVNGRAVPHRPSDDVWQQVTVVDVHTLLRRGRNVIAVRAVKPGGQGGLILQGQVALPDGKTVSLASDDTWRASSDAPDPEPLFGRWIWHPSVKPSQTVYLRRAFEVPAGARLAAALVTLTADNRFTLYLNGQRVGSHEPWMQPATFDVARHLRPGRNVLAVAAGNDDGAAGVLLGLVGRMGDGHELRVRSDEQWLAAEAAPNGWTAAGFDDSAWVHAKVVADYGAPPWGRFPDERLGIAPSWAGLEYDARDWRPAEVLGQPSQCAWHDVQAELLAGVERPLGSWLDWGLDRFSGYVDYTAAFSLPATVGRGPRGGGAAAGRVTLDLGRVKCVAEAWVNGRKVGERMWPPFSLDVTGAVRPGANSLRVRVGNLAVNEMAQFADRGLLTTWGWGPAPSRDAFDAGLFGPVTVTVQAAPAVVRHPGRAARSGPASRRAQR